MSELVSIENRGHVRHLVMNRPEKRNAFNRELVSAVHAAAHEAAPRPLVSPIASARLQGQRVRTRPPQPDAALAFDPACATKPNGFGSSEHPDRVIAHDRRMSAT